MSRSEVALCLFRRGFSCSQSVFAAFAEDQGLDRETALRLSQPFGGGIAAGGDWCGALTGAFLAVGLKYGRVRPEDAAAKEKTYALVRELIARFGSRHGAVRCRDLLGCEIGTPEGSRKASELKLHETKCEGLVADAVALLEEIL
ncbi:MAG: C-GCAxxG-C-C family protein [Acidobacteriota bacterium]